MAAFPALPPSLLEEEAKDRRSPSDALVNETGEKAVTRG